MFQRLREVISADVLEYAQEDLLHEILDRIAPREMRAGDAGDPGMQPPHEFARRGLAAAAEPGAGEFVVGSWIIIGHRLSKHGDGGNVTGKIISPR